MADSLKSLVDELSKLSSDEIALKFEGLSIKGYRKTASACPMSQYIKMQLSVFNIYTGIDSIAIYSWENDSHVILSYEKCPRSIRNFIVNFDADKYPELVKERT